MNYQEAIDYLFSQLPMFSRIGLPAYKANLDNTLALSKAFQHPERKFKSIHIAGTNGKGSTSHMLAAVFQSAGYKTALYTSPHLLDFRERIRINGQMIPEARVANFTAANKQLFEEIKPSFFEMTVAMAFDWFAEEKVDIAIIETGLGGRLDSTNILTPELSVITNISYDHTNLLGTTLDEIATEKAGIIKQHVPVIIGEKQSPIENVFTNKAEKTNSTIYFAEDLAEVSRSEPAWLIHVPGESRHIRVNPQLSAMYQQKNICTVSAAILVMRKLGWNIPDNAWIRGINESVSITGLRGRWELIRNNPRVYADIAHNEAGISALLKQIQQCTFKKLHIILGMVNDKDISKVLSMMPLHAEYYFCNAALPRALDAAELAKMAGAHHLKGAVIKPVKDALNKAIELAAEDDLLVVCGSAFVVAEALQSC